MKAKRTLAAQAEDDGRKIEAGALLTTALTVHQKGVLGPLATAHAAVRDWPEDSDAKLQERAKLAAALADAHGVEGGLHRRLGALAEAEASYARGRSLEVDPVNQIRSSYNLTSEMVVALLRTPAAGADLIGRAGTAAAVVRQQLADNLPPRPTLGDMADLGLLVLLSEKPPDAADAVDQAYQELTVTRDFPPDSMRSVIRVLQVRTRRPGTRPGVGGRVERGGRVSGMRPGPAPLSRTWGTRWFLSGFLMADALEDAGCDDADLLATAAATGRTSAAAGQSTWCWGRGARPEPRAHLTCQTAWLRTNGDSY